MTRAVSMLLLALVLVCLLGGAEPDRFAKVGHNLMCTCGCNEVLLECNHVGCPSSEGMRAKLADYVQRGQSDSLIYKEFIADYGNIVVAAPIGGGFNRVAWVAPFAVLFSGVFAVGLVAKRWQRRTQAVSESAHGAEQPNEFVLQARRETEE